MWVDESVQKLFLERDYEFNKRYLHSSINERPNDSEKNLYAAIEKMKTDGKLNYEMVTTKAVTTKPNMEDKKKANEFDQRQESSKKTESGEKTKNSDKEFDVVKKKIVQKTNSSDYFFEKINWLLVRMIKK